MPFSRVYAAHLVEAILAAACHEQGIGAFFVADDGYSTWESFASEISAAFRVEATPLDMPMPLASFRGPTGGGRLREGEEGVRL
jgi:hypothetical protein